MWQEYKEEMGVDCDKLQRIHALENLATLLKELPPPSLSQHALRREMLSEDAAEPEAGPETGAGPEPEAIAEFKATVPESDAVLTLQSQELMQEVSFVRPCLPELPLEVCLSRPWSFEQSSAREWTST